MTELQRYIAFLLVEKNRDDDCIPSITINGRVIGTPVNLYSANTAPSWEGFTPEEAMDDLGWPASMSVTREWHNFMSGKTSGKVSYTISRDVFLKYCENLTTLYLFQAAGYPGCRNGLHDYADYWKQGPQWWPAPKGRGRLSDRRE